MPSSRKYWLDWQRGLAVLFMVEVHVVDAWLARGTPPSALRDVLMMVGGFAAPSFLFLAGLSQALNDGRLAGKGLSSIDRRWIALKRAAWLLGVAYLFRVGEYFLGGMFLVPGGWRDILRVDILNVIAVGLVLNALLGCGTSARRQIVVAGTVAAVFVFATPPVAAWSHPANRLLDYLHAGFPRANFSLMNWAGFLFAGAAIGRLVVERERPFILLVLGAALFLSGWAADRLPAVYAHQDFWHTSPSWFSMRLGGVVALTGLLQWLPANADRVLVWLRPLGRHSLLAYMVSIELTFGLGTKRFQGRLSLDGVLVGVATMLFVTWLLAIIADILEKLWAEQRDQSAPSPEPSPG